MTEFKWSKPSKPNDTLYLVFGFDFKTAEPVPIALLDWEHAKEFNKANPRFSIVPYKINEMDDVTIKNYKFRIKKIPGWDFPKKEDEK